MCFPVSIGQKVQMYWPASCAHLPLELAWHKASLLYLCSSYYSVQALCLQCSLL